MEIPIQNKLCLTIEEAAAYSQIGENRLREYINTHKYSDFILWVGSHARIKRLEFEKFISDTHDI